MRRNQKGTQPVGLIGIPAPRSCRRTGVRRLAAAFALLFLAAGPCGAQEAWEGNAAVVRRGTFPEAGLFAASNSFPRDSRVEVRSLVTGTTVQVTILQRIEDTDNIFILLSEQAAERLGVSGSEVVRVTARLVTGPPAGSWKPDGEQAFNPDPDINPAAELQARDLEPPPLEEPASEPPAELPAEPPAAEAAPTDAPAAPDAAAAPERPAVEAPPTDVASPAAAPPTIEEPSPEQERLAELQRRLPQKQLFHPPRQSERFALSVPEEPAESEEPAEPAVVEAPEEAPAEEEPAQTPAIVEVEAEEAPEAEEALGPPESEPRVSLAGPQETRDALAVELPVPRPLEPDRPEVEGARLPAPEEEQPLALEPATPPLELPEEAPAEIRAAATEAVEERTEIAEAAEPEPAARETEGPAEEPAVAAAAPLAPVLTPQAYFLQLGAYSSRTLAEKLARDLGPNYQVSILPTADRTRTVYKVLIGPLNTDESGTLLYLFKARGFKDAFLRYVE